jgi:hypothetical protein
VKPDILPGDLVEVGPFDDESFEPGLVIGVWQANEVPDAQARGLIDLQPWSFWVFFSETVSCRGIRGPYMRNQIQHARQ